MQTVDGDWCNAAQSLHAQLQAHMHAGPGNGHQPAHQSAAKRAQNQARRQREVLYLRSQPGAQRLGEAAGQAEEAVAAALSHQAPKHVLCAALVAWCSGQRALHVPVQAWGIVEGLAQVKELGKGSVRLCQAFQALQQGLAVLSDRVCACPASIGVQVCGQVAACAVAASVLELLVAREHAQGSHSIEIHALTREEPVPKAHR